MFLKVRSAKIDGKSLDIVQHRYFFFSGPPKVSDMTLPTFVTVPIGPVSHELYVKKISKKNLHSKSIFFDDIDLNFTRFSPNRLILKENSK